MNYSLTTNFLKWWLLLILIVIGASVAWYFDFFLFLLEYDFTRLGFFTLFIFCLNSISIGIKIYNDNRNLNTEWFWSDAVISIGMIGTVIGFIYMLFSVFSNIDLTDSIKMMSSLSEMAKGMSTALLTTLTGLVSSMLLKLQLIIAKAEQVHV